MFEQCDEARPVCGSCARHKVDCLYDRAAEPAAPETSPPSSLGAGAPPAPASTSSSASPLSFGSSEPGALSAESRDRRYRELGLLHLFIIEVCQTIPGTYLADNLRIWTAEVPKLAFSYEPLLNAILGLCILYEICSGHHEHDARKALLVHRANYLEATLQEHRQAIASLDRRTAEAASFTSVILSFDAFASLRERRFRSPGPYQPPSHWLQMCRGVRNVTDLSLNITREDRPTYIKTVAESTADLIDRSLIFSESNRALFPHLLERSPDETEDDRDHDAYMDTVSYIGSVMAAQDRGEDRRKVCRRLIIFPMLLPARFIDLLSQRRPRAMAILAHYFALATSFSEFWWIGDTPVQEILAIESCLGPEWQGVMTWPLQTAHRWSPVST